MQYAALRTWVSKNEAVSIVMLATIIAGALFSFEYMTGLSASLRSDPVYNVLSTPRVHKAASTRSRMSVKERARVRRASQKSSKSAASAGER